MSGVSRRHFLFGRLLAGLIPRAGFGSVPSLRFLGYQSPNEKMNIAGVGAGGRAMSFTEAVGRLQAAAAPVVAIAGPPVRLGTRVQGW